MSSLPKHNNPGITSSSFKQSSRTTTTGGVPTATTAASSRPRPIEHPLAQRSQDIIHPRPTSREHVPSLGISQVQDKQPDDDHADENDDGDNVPRPDPDFRPFFTLIEDPNTSDYHHPTVHYIFSDDDPDLITEAALRALENGHTSPARNAVHGDSSGEGSDTGHRPSPGVEKPSCLPPPLPGVKERFVVLDVERTSSDQGQGVGGPSLAPDAALGQFATSAGTGTSISTSPAQRQPHQGAAYGYRVISAHSLTPDWQVLNTSLSLAPTFDTPQNTNEQGADPAAVSSGALMLRIEGTAGFPRDVATGKDRDTKGQTLEEMMEQFEKRMSELRRVIEAGEGCPLLNRPAGGDGEFDTPAKDAGTEAQKEVPAAGAETTETKADLAASGEDTTLA